MSPLEFVKVPELNIAAFGLKLFHDMISTLRHCLRKSRILIMIIIGGLSSSLLFAQANGKSEEGLSQNEPLTIRKCEDFEIDGSGENKAWSQTKWVHMTKLDQGGRDYESKFKMLFSSTGLYVLFEGEDDKITTKDFKDFDNIFDGDVFEVFFHPDPSVNVYFEYEVNQLAKELVLMISNINGHGYRPWIPRNYSKGKGAIKQVVVTGGDKKVDGSIQSWRAEIFFPYGILGLLPDVAPKSGSVWHANFCRLDYDTGKMVKWSWTPSIKSSFHELEAFRSIKFE